jgi:hypothetical protein
MGLAMLEPRGVVASHRRDSLSRRRLDADAGLPSQFLRIEAFADELLYS